MKNKSTHTINRVAVSGDALGVQEDTIFFILALNVGNEPVLEKAHDRQGQHAAPALEFLLQIEHLLDQLFMFTLVPGQVRVPIGLHHLFLILEMGGRIGDERLQDHPQHGVALSGLHRVMQLIEKIHQLFVLIVEFLYLDT